MAGTVLVTGATGNQGGAVVDHLPEAGGFDIRGLTRDTSSEAARALEERGVRMVEGDDVGGAATVAFEEPEAFVGERIDLGGDEATLEETADALSTVTGRDVEGVHVPIEDAYDAFSEEFTVMCEWFNEEGYSADIDAMVEIFGFEFTDLEEYLREHGWTEKEGMAATPGWVKAMK